MLKKVPNLEPEKKKISKTGTFLAFVFLLLTYVLCSALGAFLALSLYELK